MGLTSVGVDFSEAQDGPSGFGRLSAQDAEVSLAPDVVSCLIVIGLPLVNRAVQLNDKANGVAVEVGDEAVHDLLAAKVQAVQAVAAQVIPEQSSRQASSGDANALAANSFASPCGPMTTAKFRLSLP